ncbi:MAG: LLM class flavin-dependent oxidoreductase [Halobacteriales archaeon]|nr:LLM class flavin-dependent oxidoreductase [Halobacteriales archaeon]
MQLGITLSTYATDGWRMPASRLVDCAQSIEEAGFAGIWISEHLTRPPGREYSWLAPLTTAATVVGATESIPVGTSIAVMPLRNPVHVAHQVASLQHLSEERFTLGLGAGYVHDDYAALGVPYAERGPRFSEGLSLLMALLSEESVTFDGRFYSVSSFSLEPRPARRPRVLVGGGGVDGEDGRAVPDPVIDRIAMADGWIAAPRRPGILGQDWAEIASALETAGRDPTAIDRLAMNWAYLVPGVEADLAWEKQRAVIDGKDDPETARDHYLTGSIEDIQERLAWYEREGYDHVLLGPITPDPAMFERQIEYYVDYLDAFL